MLNTLLNYKILFFLDLWSNRLQIKVKEHWYILGKKSNILIEVNKQFLLPYCTLRKKSLTWFLRSYDTIAKQEIRHINFLHLKMHPLRTVKTTKIGNLIQTEKLTHKINLLAMCMWGGYVICIVWYLMYLFGVHLYIYIVYAPVWINNPSILVALELLCRVVASTL